ncbi:MAG: hypothetical protein ABIS26_02170, partial [Candidatus Paceibacterota bacterium]
MKKTNYLFKTLSRAKYNFFVIFVFILTFLIGSQFTKADENILQCSPANQTATVGQNVSFSVTPLVGAPSQNRFYIWDAPGGDPSTQSGQGMDNFNTKYSALGEHTVTVFSQTFGNDPSSCHVTITTPPPIKIVASAVTCDYESNLPNWYHRTDSRLPIVASTAPNYVNGPGNRNCRLDSGWDFYYITSDDYANGRWPGTFFGTTGANGRTVPVSISYDKVPYRGGDMPVNIDGKRAFLYMDPNNTKRSAGYVPFADPYPSDYDAPLNPAPYSAEFHCWDDSRVVYSNGDYVGDMTEELLDWGSTYYCIGFNALVTPPPATINVKEIPRTGGTWRVMHGLLPEFTYTGSSNSVFAEALPKGTTYILIVDSYPAGCTSASVNSSDGGNTVNVTGRDIKQFTITYTCAEEPSVNLQANGSDGPITVNPGDSVTLTWESNNVTSCTGTNFSTNGAPNNTSPGVSTGALTSTQTYSIKCTEPGTNGLGATDSVTVNVKGAAMTGTL